MPRVVWYRIPPVSYTHLFAYDAIAISHYNNVVMKTVDDSAFGGAARSFVIYPDGQVVIENISEDSESIYNFIAILQEYSDLTEAQIQELTDDFAQGVPVKPAVFESEHISIAHFLAPSIAKIERGRSDVYKRQLLQ